MKFEFYDEKGNVRKDLFSEDAEKLANEIVRESSRQKNSITQIRKFYDEVLRFKIRIEKNPEKFDTFLPYIKMLNAKVVYAKGRNKVSQEFEEFIKRCISQIKEKKDFEVFVSFFEAFIGFYRAYGRG